MLAGFIAAADSSLDAAVYEVSGYWAYVLGAAARRGVRTRLLLDRHPGANSTTVRRLAGGPVLCRVARPVAPGGGMPAACHWKLIVRDADSLAVGSGNLIKRDTPRQRPDLVLPGTREWWVVVEGSAALARDARWHLDQAWRESAEPPVSWLRAARPAAPPIGVPTPLVAPLTVPVDEDGIRMVLGGDAHRRMLHRLLAEARLADITVPYVHAGRPAVRQLLSDLNAARRRGAKVRLLLGSVPAAGDAAELSCRGPATRVMDPLRSTTGHAKGAIVDGQVLVGSANWSQPGLGGNREAGVLVEDAAAAAYFRAAFDRDWAVAKALPEAGLRGGPRGYALDSS